MSKRELLTPALREMRAAFSELDELSTRAEVSKRDEQRVNVLLAKIAALRQNSSAVPNNTVRNWFRAIAKGQDPGVEYRATDMLAGTQSISYTQGAEGGYLVPQEFHDELILGISQVDPFLDENAVTLLESATFSLKPYTVPGWDLSAYAAAQVNEGSQQNPQTVPTAAKSALGSYTFRATLDASLELEDDDFQPVIDQMKKAYTIAFARGIGAALATGNGSSAPQGIVTGAANSGITTSGSGVIDAADIESIYFSLDRAYRANPKCAWAMSDAVYHQVRSAVDNNLRPLINVVGDRELLMGKPILVSPSISSTAGQKGIVFGDLAHFFVRLSNMVVTRNTQAPGYIEYGKALYTARMRADSKVFDPTGGNKPPIVYATLHS